MKYLLLICLISKMHFLSAQGNQLENNYHFTGLKEGDKMPDIPLGIVINNNTGKSKFSDFRGKLIILDFWNTYCTSCMDAFPKMEKLQQKFEGQIQIFIVNPWETQAQIDERLNKSYLKKHRLPKLPSIVDAKILNELLPVNQGIPHHVWIDGQGIIRLRGFGGGGLSTNEENILNLLTGKTISYVKDGNTTPLFDKEKPYYTLLKEKSAPSLQYGSFITRHNNEYAAWNTGEVENIIDSTSQTIRNTYINLEVLELYKSVFKKSIEKNREKTIFSSKSRSPLYWLDYFVIHVEDTTNYTSGFLPISQVTGKSWMKNKFCYEQISPRNFSEESRQQIMLSDLNRYFGNLCKIEGRLEKQTISCFVLVRTSANLKIATKSAKFKIEDIFENGQRKKAYHKLNLKGLLESICVNLMNNPSIPSFILLDETNFTEKVDMILPQETEIRTIDDLRKALRPYNLDILETSRELEMVVIAEKNK